MILKDVVKKLGKEFGKITKWQYVCKLHNIQEENEKIRVALQILQEPCSGGTAEAFAYWIKLKALNDGKTQKETNKNKETIATGKEKENQSQSS